MPWGVARPSGAARFDLRPGKHVFPQQARSTAYDFLADALA
jgi:hypothetical protein